MNFQLTMALGDLQADLVTAWDGELMVGIAHALIDFGYVGYLGDLAVRTSPPAARHRY